MFPLELIGIGGNPAALEVYQIADITDVGPHATTGRVAILSYLRGVVSQKAIATTPLDYLCFSVK